MLYRIENENFIAAVDSLGAQLISLKRRDGRELIWTGDAKYWTGRAPVLFPIVGALRDGKACINGKTYEMGQHGFARHSEFGEVEQSPGKISLTLRDNPSTWRQYPFSFALTVTYTLSKNGYKTSFTVQNTGDGVLPFSVGGHPGFNIPVDENAAFEDYSIVFEKPETQHCPAIVMGKGLIDPSVCGFVLENEVEIPLKHNLFYNDALVFEDLNSRFVRIVNKATGHGIAMEFGGFPLLGIWSAQNDGPYVCLEPWTGCATRTDEGDEFIAKHRMTMLPPGEIFTREFRVSIL